MRVVYLHQYFNTPEMSGGTRSWEMGRRLVEAGHEVHMVTTDRDPAPGVTDWYVTEEAGMTVHWLPVAYSNRMGFRKRILAFLRFAVRSRKKARELGGDVVFATSTPLTIAIPAVHAARRNGIPLVFEVRDLWPELPIAVGALKSPILKYLAHRLERFAYGNASRIIALSAGMKDGVVRAGYPEDRVTVVPNASDLDAFQGREEGGRRIRLEHEWLGDRPMVIYAGTIGIINGVDYLARVAAAAAGIDPEIQFVVLGSGHEEDAVRAVAESLGVLGTNFHLLGRRPKLEMPDWLAAADLATSLFVDIEAMWANSANKFFDALAAGRPVAINYRGWQKEVIEVEGCGLVLPPDDVEHAARLVTERLRDPAWTEAARANALRVARERYSREDLYEAFEAVLRSAVDGARA